MYMNALEFLEEERDAWRPYEALAELPDEGLERPGDPAGPTHGWSGRQLACHLMAWQSHALDVVKELAVSPTSPARERMVKDFESRGIDAVNDDFARQWMSLPLGEVRQRLRELPGELRGYLTVVPETRWIRDPAVMGFIAGDTVEHYEEHRPELEAVLGASRW